jgi:porin
MTTRSRKSRAVIGLWFSIIALGSVRVVWAQEPDGAGTPASPAVGMATADPGPPGNATASVVAAAPQPVSATRRFFLTSMFGAQTPAPPTQAPPPPLPALPAEAAAANDLRGNGGQPSPGTDGNPTADDLGAAFADAAGPVRDDQGASRGSQSIASNPAAVNIIAGTGALGRALGLSPDSGVRLGGFWIGDASNVFSGGRAPGWGLNSLTVADLNFDFEKMVGWQGASIGMQYLNFVGQPTNNLAGAFPGFDSLEAGPPLSRNELYQLWFRQTLFDNKLIVRIGKSVPTYDFNNVSNPVPTEDDPSASIPAVTSLIYTPIFVNPTMLGVIPGYYNSTAGLTVTFAPTKQLYFNFGFYDGNLANPNLNQTQPGFTGVRFNGYYFYIGEAGYAYRLGAQRKPGNFGVGVWGQTGKLRDWSSGNEAAGDLPTGRVNGAAGVYLFGSQRLWFRNPGVDNSGVSGFYQFGTNNSSAMLARDYVGGGLTAFNLVPGRPDDSFGFGLAWTELTTGQNSAGLFYPSWTGNHSLRSNQLMLEWYYQMKVVNGVFFQTALSDIPTPGQGPNLQNAVALTLRITVLF